MRMGSPRQAVKAGLDGWEYSVYSLWANLLWLWKTVSNFVKTEESWPIGRAVGI